MNFPGKKSAGSFSISLLIHGVLLSLLGLMVCLVPARRSAEPIVPTLGEIQESPLLEEEKIPEPLPDPAEASLSAPGGEPAPEVTAEAVFSFLPEVITTADQPPQSINAPTPTVRDSGAGPATFGKGFDRTGESGAGPVGNGTQAAIHGMTLSAKKLGVLLDISGSMHPYLEETVRQIRRQFPHYELILVEGCCVGWFQRSEEQFQKIQIRRGGSSVFEGLAGNHLPPEGYAFIEKAGTANVLAAVDYLLREKNCDAVYFFSDFRDTVNEGGVEKLRGLLKGRALYLDSIGTAPSEDLARLALKTGGRVNIEKR